MLVIPQETKNKISVRNAPSPSPNIDPNVGKQASLKSGPYADLPGILYPPHEGVWYIGKYDIAFEGFPYNSDKMFLLMMFYDDGTFFCAVPVDFSDVTVVGGIEPRPPGSGTVADPFSCNHLVKSDGSGSQTFIHELPKAAGRIMVRYNFYGIADRMYIYFIDDPTTPILESGAKIGEGFLYFNFDPAYNPNRIIVRINDGTSTMNTSWEYRIGCPEQV